METKFCCWSGRVGFVVDSGISSAIGVVSDMMRKVTSIFYSIFESVKDYSCDEIAEGYRSNGYRDRL